MKQIIMPFYLVLTLFLAGCATTKYQAMNPQEITAEGIEFFENKKFSLLDLGAGPDGSLAIATFKSISVTSPSIPAKRLAEYIRKNKRLVVYGAGNSAAEVIIKDAFKLCIDDDLSDHKILFVLTAAQQEQVEEALKKSGVQFGVKLHQNENS